MKKIILLLIVLIGLATTNIMAQDYRTAIGGKFYAGNGNVGGINLKHFMNEHGALEGSLLFATNTIGLEGLYNWHGRIPGASGLKFFVGGGGAVFFQTRGGSNSAFALRADLGLDYKFTGAPIAVSVGLDPFFYLSPVTNSVFTVGLGFRYVIK